MVFVTFKDALNDLLKNGALYIAIALVAIMVITLVILFIKNRKKN
jgi:hypothetical protein